MSDFETTCRLIRLEVPEVIAAACRYLEKRGKRFCIEFGYENAVELAMQESEKEFEETGWYLL